jgi:hypothetical protein
MKKPVKTIQLTEEHGTQLYDVFVHFLNMNFGGPKTQRTPTTDSAQRIASHMQDKDGGQLCYELCREFLSNDQRQATASTKQ